MEKVKFENWLKTSPNLQWCEEQAKRTAKQENDIMSAVTGLHNIVLGSKAVEITFRSSDFGIIIEMRLVKAKTYSIREIISYQEFNNYRFIETLISMYNEILKRS